ncbi:brassinosteroid-related acyltransferase 1 [Rhodamnia argentea]|uniref:Brassinosteroid-related acyltransferase 1 n=1 Tax=Rhodamnia argentea TaxID=178133 RepID=A0A8B8MRD1_9MYRT|nr:brassinosteroid-related acyltransferase 1 [Rhodamnia argentea]
MATPHESHHPNVSIRRTIIVRPKSMQPPKLLNLSNLDRQCPALMFSVFFYKPPLNDNFSKNEISLGRVFDSLRLALEETLTVWHPAAGRLSLNQEDGKLNLWCNNEGVVLAEAVAQVKVSELGDLSEYNEFFEKLVYKPDFDGDLSKMPLVVAQVTQFECGGYSIGIGTSHSLFDGPAAYNFLHAWSSNSTITKEKGCRHEIPMPVHDRGRLLLLNPQKQVAIANPVKSAAAIEHLYQLIMQSTVNPNILSDVKSSSLVLKTFDLCGEFIESLKRELCKGMNGNFSCSSFEVVSSHLWKARTKALGLNKGTLVCLQFAVDTRNRVSPPLPKGFSGNAYVLTSVALTAGELMDLSQADVIEKIREAKRSVNDEYVMAYMKALEGPPGSLPPLKELTLVSDWTRMPFHKVGFLSEEAAYVSPLVPPIPQVAYLMQKPTGDHLGIHVRIGLPSEISSAFAKYFLSVNPWKKLAPTDQGIDRLS